jgi:ADP-heptose:LPS heptosyltransferase
VTARRVLMVRLDSLGDVLVCGPAVRAVAAAGGPVTLLTGPRGAAAALLLPGVEAVLEWDCPWIAAEPPTVEAARVGDLVERLAAARFDEAVILTSFHQSALPTALVLRLAGVPRITAVSEDYPGRLLDVRVSPPPDAPEPVRMLTVARAAGFALPPGDEGRLAIRPNLPPPPGLPRHGFAVVHPGTDAPARAYPGVLWREVVRLLTARGTTVLVTGSASERALTAAVTSGAELPGSARDCGGSFSIPALAATLERASVVVCANTGPAHLAAAVGTPVVTLFAPVVPVERWAPFGVGCVVLGDQEAPCRDSRARVCPVAGHPCLAGVRPEDVVSAAASLVGDREGVPA